jgi:hypothetical protein
MHPRPGTDGLPESGRLALSWKTVSTHGEMLIRWI